MDTKQLQIAIKILQIGAFGVFFGHGMVALQGNTSWIILLTSVGIDNDTAHFLLPVIGSLDIIVAFLVLFLPLRIILIWMVFWAFSTALVRPVAGYPIWAFIERAANWAVPLALLFLQGFPKKSKDLFKIK